ncbi:MULTISPECIES: L-rhamnose/proton symporter RhaT [unclassified Mucilaginibacter]|uniref:L-rhamnose/proton symporter RhaT n=1 Tax=unclassified Mucilaginibacter TaxID=2617802 RepID=UPI002AC9DE73|nr:MULTISPECIES: L-rhamnose/proton symporter RhaT [unclassified Mucilaginibacter]MEB0264034.1 L-rhamnose/proton symporter RhaT [Mucilaginibacter sp. 10I4]MEB0279757.1 L-rhamnose/proton symporter RhaT [Mucilaginibacter sp. 10B2]MEB0301620.1 L-rhamnose/proton symporter RhaT [Mucilaginibacter sp. 5C4]WPX23685.1 L-rhamnose/proton symporter RhaT [Mucilaginibacter sp. 5C4]
MQAIFGIIFHFIGGFASGSFYIPYKKVKGWAWESFWIVGGIFSWLIAPPVAAWLTIPGFADIIKHTNGQILLLTYFFGVLWGVGGLTYGLGVRYLGVALGSTIILGLCSVFGSLIPSIYYDFFPQQGKDSITTLLHSHWGQMVLLGIVVCVLGIMICGYAGVMKERELTKDQEVAVNNTEYKFGLGIFVAIVSGVLSACFAFGIDAGKVMANEANTAWKALHPAGGEFLFQNNVTYVVILWGGLSTNFIWCMVLNARNKTFGDYTNKKTPLKANYIFSALAGTTWFLQFFFYGMGESRLGNGASSWILHMAFIILIANVWGLVLKEWKGVSKKALATVFAGIVTIIISVLIVGYGNSIKG